MSCRLVIPALALLLMAGGALAGDGLGRCRALSDDAARLACYDALPLPGAAMTEFRGKGGGLTDAFRITTPQMLTYESDDIVLVAYLLDGAGQVVQNLHHAGVGAGRFLIESPGTYRVQVNATGGWRVSVGPP